jgi:hypothetical protein
MTIQPEGGSLDESAALAAELKALRKGRGLGSAAFEVRLGPHLGELATGAPESAGPAADSGRVRRALAAELTVLAARLPAELCTAIQASLGLAPTDKELKFFADRVSWLAARIDRDPRTALRRIGDAERLLAEEIAAELRRRRGQQSSKTAGGWYVAQFSTLLLLDRTDAEALERRRIVATAADLTEISLSLDVPPRDPGHGRVRLTVDMVSGGELIKTENSVSGRTTFGVRLPTPLQPGQSHEFEISVKVDPRAWMRTYYVFTPERRCDAFDLRVRFDRRRPPAWVRRVDSEPVRVYEVVTRGGPQVPIDAAGEAGLAFQSLALNVGYGIQWSESDPALNGVNKSIFGECSGLAQTQA